MTDVAKNKQFLRIMQSASLPKAEVIQAWIVQIGHERIEKSIDPEQAIDCDLEIYFKKAMIQIGAIKGCFQSISAMSLLMRGQKRRVGKRQEYAMLVVASM